MIKEWVETLDWKTSKNYTHFDIKKIFKNSQEKIDFFENFFGVKNILKYAFKPFIRYEIKEKKFTKFEDEIPDDNYFYKIPNKSGSVYWHKEKLRPITYASHLDSEIYSYYSFMLWKKYEEYLSKSNLLQNILAYRTVEKDRKNNKIIWKNNIDFAVDIFQDILEAEDCITLAFDISWFFDTLNHNILKKELINILWGADLEDDWYKIFKNLTRFSYVDKTDIIDNNLIKKYDARKEFPKIIDIVKFNQLKSEYKKTQRKLIKTNPKFPENNPKNPDKKLIWIPQGTPISGMLANLYMLQFDIELKKYADDFNGKYYRYSDDIFLIIPYSNTDNYLEKIQEISNFTLNKISQKLELKINNDKTEISIFSNKKIIKNIIYSKEDQKFNFSKKNIQPIQYLWFTFDWERVLIRNKTLSNYYKKLVWNIKRLKHLNDSVKNKNWDIIRDNSIKWDKILLWKYNRKYLFNWKYIWGRYKKEDWKYQIDKNDKPLYLWFLSYWYNASNIFETFCENNHIKNWIKNQLKWHRKKYNELLVKHSIKKRQLK